MTAQLLEAMPAAARVVAVEPVDAMRAELAAAAPRAQVLAGTAEALPLADGAADMLVVAQAFHWFATRAALAEFARVLRPGGHLVLVWNDRDTTVPWIRRLEEEIIGPAYPPDVPRQQTGAWRTAMAEAADLFTASGTVDSHYEQPGGLPMVVDRVLSLSVVNRLPADEQAAIQARVEALATAEHLPPDVHFRYTSAAHLFIRN